MRAVGIEPDEAVSRDGDGADRAHIRHPPSDRGTQRDRSAYADPRTDDLVRRAVVLHVDVDVGDAGGIWLGDLSGTELYRRTVLARRGAAGGQARAEHCHGARCAAQLTATASGSQPVTIGRARAEHDVDLTWACSSPDWRAAHSGR